MTTYNTPYCGAPILHDSHGFIVTNNGIPYTIVCPGRRVTSYGGPRGLVGEPEKGSSDG